jgi:hypothetical protein
MLENIQYCQIKLVISVYLITMFCRLCLISVKKINTVSNGISKTHTYLTPFIQTSEEGNKSLNSFYPANINNKADYYNSNMKNAIVTKSIMC